MDHRLEALSEEISIRRTQYLPHEPTLAAMIDARTYILELEAENARLKADMAEAAGEFLVPMPEPGTPTAKLLAANVLLRRENARLKGNPSDPMVRLSVAREAFQAGVQRGIGSHMDFKQVHPDFDAWYAERGEGEGK